MVEASATVAPHVGGIAPEVVIILCLICIIIGIIIGRKVG